jgi:hypothetical protein
VRAAGERFGGAATRRIGVGVTLAAAVLIVVFAAVLTPLVLVALPVELLFTVRFARLGTYVVGDERVLRDVLATRRIRRDEIERLAVEKVHPAGAPMPYAAGVAIRRDGRRVQLAGIAEGRSQPDEPHATLRRLADALGVPPPA